MATDHVTLFGRQLELLEILDLVDNWLLIGIVAIVKRLSIRGRSLESRAVLRVIFFLAGLRDFLSDSFKVSRVVVKLDGAAITEGAPARRKPTVNTRKVHFFVACRGF